MKEIVVKSYGKINLALDILYKRSDNYHEIRSIMQSIDFFDRLIFKEQEKGITIETNNPDVPTDKENIVYRAWESLKPYSKTSTGIHIKIEKNIPVASGLAGGSSNGAVTLRVLNKMWNLNLSEEKLMEIGGEIGADIPFCLMGGTALAEGIGEKLTPLKPFVDKLILLCNPDIKISTPYAYSLIDTNKEKYDLRDLIYSLEQDDIYGVSQNLKNKMEEPIIKKYPIIKNIQDIMKSSGSLGTLMSGSGSTVFGIFDDKEKLEFAYKRLLKLTKQVYITKTI
jgi:4-diphosphocytidyl-2-C-methyl-D-erythritol kinase